MMFKNCCTQLQTNSPACQGKRQISGDCSAMQDENKIAYFLT
jgi:hypothetical protein